MHKTAPLIRGSVLCITTFDKGAIGQLQGVGSSLLSNIAFFEIITGLIMTLISLARFIGMLPSVDQVDE